MKEILCAGTAPVFRDHTIAQVLEAVFDSRSELEAHGSLLVLTDPEDSSEWLHVSVQAPQRELTILVRQGGWLTINLAADGQERLRLADELLDCEGAEVVQRLLHSLGTGCSEPEPWLALCVPMED